MPTVSSGRLEKLLDLGPARVASSMNKGLGSPYRAAESPPRDQPCFISTYSPGIQTMVSNGSVNYPSPAAAGGSMAWTAKLSTPRALPDTSSLCPNSTNSRKQTLRALVSG
jgi:hypothetical protein